MPFNPGDKLQIKVEAYNGTGWVEITSRARKAGGLKVEHGGTPGAIQAETSIMEITLGNPDAELTEGNPQSNFYPWFGRGCLIRLSYVGVLVGDAQRFSGKIEQIIATYPGGPDSAIRVTAVGEFGFDGIGSDILGSALFRSYSGITSDDIAPRFYWPMEDLSSATSLASAVGSASPLSITAEVSPASDSTLVSSLPLPTITAGGFITAAVPTYPSTSQVAINVVAKIPAEPAAEAGLFELILAGGAIGRILVYVTNGSPAGVMIRGYSPAGTILFDNGYLLGDGILPEESGFFGQWATYGVQIQASTSGVDVWWGVTVTDVLGASGNNVAGSPGRLTGVRIYGDLSPSVGHLGVWNDPGFSITLSGSANAEAMFGWAGEQAHERIERLCREQGKTCEIIGTVSMTMGAQQPGTLRDLLQECADADGGILSDGGTDGAIVYRTLDDLTNQDPALTISHGAVGPALRPAWDYQQVRNDVTATRTGGSSARVTNERSVTDRGARVRASPTVNVETDIQVYDRAGWTANLGSAAGPRYPAVPVNMRNLHGAQLADAILGLSLGDRLTIAATALADQHPPGGADLIVVGWVEEVDPAGEWWWSPYCLPYAPYAVGVLDDDWVWDNDGSVLMTAETATDTTWKVHNVGDTQWSLTAGDWPIELTAGGEDVSATSVAAATPSYIGAGVMTHAVNTTLSPSLHASTAAGDTILVFAAYRSASVSAKIETPAGYTRLMAFRGIAVFGKYAAAGEAAPTITFPSIGATGDVSAQTATFRNVGLTVHAAAPQNNPVAAQNIVYPDMLVDRPNCLILWVGRKSDDWTSVATIAGATEIGEGSTTTGSDQGIVWDYQLQTTATDITAGQFTVTGGTTAASHSAVIALATDVQNLTVTRAVNSISKAQTANTAVDARLPLILSP